MKLLSSLTRRGRSGCASVFSAVRRLAHLVRELARFLRFGLVGAALLPALLVVAGCTTLPHAAPTAVRGGWNTAAQDGSGTPTVVLEAGLGDTMGVWGKVYPEVARFTSVFAYTRRGYGLSSPVLLNRHGDAIVEELRALLRARGLRPPYVLVGHSAGGLYLQLFAKLHPDEVAGLVLVDPTHPDQLERMRVECPKNYRIVRAMTSLQLTSPLGAEFRGLDATGEQWHAAGAFPTVPSIVLTGTKPKGFDDAAFVAFKQRLHDDLVRALPGAEHRLVPDSGHYIQKERPDLVVAAIKDVVERARRAQR